MDGIDFGTFLRDKRTRRGLTLSSLAEASGVSQTYITNVENGKRGAPSPEILKKLTEPLGVSYVELMVRAGYVTFDDWRHTKDGSLEDYDDWFYPEMLGFSREEWLNELVKIRSDIHHLLKMGPDEATYNGHRLTPEDKQRILDMLKVLLPQYQEPAKEK
ncbi:helix-turn-helix domain-containing protein [Paenibacillus herberti]|uniref:HTH cro/C1-type domain-containing protein n=1 Tax=Paenibacillus herberti TaxID=1619309 RepID=A0A229P0M7_9BACL|nr:helix-turn-helix domain-containing protein [Paenibacillus herberti]OXM15439.1 hypothetical protein CGZ75_01475 [Paenibacillus herberti]